MRTPLFAVLTALSLVACGDDGGETPAIDAAAVDAPPGVDAPAVDAVAIDAVVVIDAPPSTTFTLTSTGITAGGVIPDLYSCQGTNVSPPLAWTGGPVAPGYAVVLTDMSNGLVHSIIWDIPGVTLMLPENVAKVAEPPVPSGAKQPLAYDGQTRGYLGPCPGSTHTYQFVIYAVDEYPLSGVTLASNRTAVRTAILAHDTASASLTATFTP